MRYALGSLLLLHGLIHLLGFLQAWHVIKLPQLAGPTLVPLTAYQLRFVGLAWLVAAIVLVGAAVLLVVNPDGWWGVALIGVCLSQLLIVLQWHDARWGTLANALLLVAIIPGAAIARFHHASLAQAEAIRARASATPAPPVAEAALTGLPAPVRRWLRASGIVGKPRPTHVELQQRGQLRTAPDAPFVEAVATQTFTIDPPAFVWSVDLTMGHVLPIVGRDTCVDGRGHMLIRAAGLKTVADGQGPKFDQGTLLRFLGETIWFPAAALAPYVSWRGLDDHDAEATLTFGGTTVTAIFTVDDRGRVSRLRASRYFGDGKLEAWEIPITEWRTIRGIEMPTRGTAVWKLAAGDFEYFRWEILDVVSDGR